MTNYDVIHVIPINDLIEHDTSGEEDCLCGPETELVQGPEGEDRWVVTHNALDGREHEEEDHDREACPLCSSQEGRAA